MRGLGAILPTILTIALVLWLIGLIDNYVGQYVNRLAQAVAVHVYHAVGNLPAGQAGWDAAKDRILEIWDNWRLDVLGFLLAIVIIYVLGLFVASFIGRAVWRGIESLLLRVPLINQIYPSVKQVTDFFLGDAKLEFKRVVAVEYPRKGIWSVALVTNNGMRTLQSSVGAEMLTLFVPSSPTPFTGYTMVVRRDEVIDLPLTIDEALRFTVSGGMVLPAMELPGGGVPPAGLPAGPAAWPPKEPST